MLHEMIKVEQRDLMEEEDALKIMVVLARREMFFSDSS